MRNRSLFAPVGLAALALVLSAGRVSAETRDTSVPNNFVNVYVGFTSVNNTDVKTTGNDASWIGQTAGKPFVFNMKNLKQENTVWGGFGGGHWFKQAPVSIGVSGTMDFFSAVIKDQTTGNFTSVVNGVDTTKNFSSYTKYHTEVMQMVPGVNLLVGVPLKFARVYGGIGPGMFMSFYTFTMRNRIGGPATGYATAMDTKIGYNAFVGADVFIARHWSVFVEGKYSEVNDLAFTPAPSQVGGRNITDTYSSIKTQRLAIGGSYHF